MNNASQFVGDIPRHYDNGLGPVLFASFAQDLARRVSAHAPRSVLEIGAGTGIVTRALRDRLPSDCTLTATDLNAPMLEIAKAKFRENEQVTFQPADAMALGFDDDSFDAIACQFAVMFFPDKPASYREAMRVLRPGGAYHFNTWSSSEDNPFSAVVQSLAEEIFPDDPPQFYKVPFGYSDQVQVLGDLKAAGCERCEVATVERDQPIPDLELFARGLIFGNPIIAEIEAHHSVTPEEVMQRMMLRLSEAFGPEPLHMPLKVSVFTVRKPD